MNLDRLESLIGKENLNKLQNIKIAIVGIGGVGGYVLEGLVRSGVMNITLIDGDKIDPTNLNRQIISTSNNIGELKVNEAAKRVIQINPNVIVNKFSIFLTKENIQEIIDNDFDYVIDACDDVAAKIELIKFCYKNNIKIISSMGTAKKLDGNKFKIDTLNNTKYCPLAKKIRKSLSLDEQKYTTVVYSEEVQKDINVLGSISYVPAIAGLLICNAIINDIIKIEN